MTVTTPIKPIVPHDDNQDVRRQQRQIGPLTVGEFIAALQHLPVDAMVVIQDPDDTTITPAYPLLASIGGEAGWITIWKDGAGREERQLIEPVVFITTYFEGRWESGPPVPEP